jgi:transitional endoplasmic reticulum ATPase
MFQLILTFLRVLGFLLPIYWTTLLAASVTGHYHLAGVNGLRYAIATVATAGCIVLASGRRWFWTQVAFVVLSLGMLRILLAFGEYSLYAPLVWGAGLVLMALEQKRRNRITSQPQMGMQAEGQQPNRPAQPAKPEYAYDHLVRRARYNFSQIVGMADTRKRLRAAAQEILTAQTPVKGQPRKDPRNGVMLFGEPGNGKTLFAEALAGELNVPFLPIAYGDVASKWINETPQKIKAVFDQARRMGGGVVFIDEFDSFVKSRDAGGAHSMDQDMTNVMLTEIVALRGTRVVLVGATNHIDRLDPAAIREGRFDYKVEVPSPDFEARKAILSRSIVEALGPGSTDVQTVANLAERWEGFSASRLATLGGQLREMRRDGVFGATARVTFELGMKAMRLLQGRKGKLPENVKPIDGIIMPAHSRDVLRDLAFRMNNVFNLEKIGGRIPAGLVFAGPPGTGKTQAAMSLARESGYAFLSTTGGQIIARMPGHSSRAERPVPPAGGLRGGTRSADTPGALPLPSVAATTRCPAFGGIRERRRPRRRSDRGSRADPRADTRRARLPPHLSCALPVPPDARLQPPAHPSEIRIRPGATPARR